MPIPPESDAEQSGEKMVCPSCHHHNDPSVTFCQSCGAPLGFAATMAPFQQLEAQGFVLRQATGGRPKLIILMGIWILVFPVWVGFSVILFENIRNFDWSFTSKVYLLGHAFIWIISVWLLYRATANYVSKRRQQQNSEKAA